MTAPAKPATATLLFVLAASARDAYAWAAAEDIPRSRVRPIATSDDVRYLRGIHLLNYTVRDSWFHAPLQVIHEVQHRIAWIRGNGCAVNVLHEPEHFDQFRATPRPEPVYKMSEDDLLDWVMATAELYGWMRVHYRPAKTAKGYRTPLKGDKGCPDVILARDSVVILAELKSDTGRVQPEQKKWLAALGVYGCVWRPADRDQILEILR